jgi:hypothetical protein
MDQVELRDRLRGRMVVRMYPPEQVDRFLRLLDPRLRCVRRGAIVPAGRIREKLPGCDISRQPHTKGGAGEMRRGLSRVNAVCRHDNPLWRVLMVKEGVDGGRAARPDRVPRLFREVGENKRAAGYLDSYEPLLVSRAPDLPRPADLGLSSVRCRSER